MQGGDHTRLLDETGAIGLVIQFVQYLDCDLAVEGLLGGEIDLRHPALAQAAVHKVARYFKQIVVHGFRVFGI
ncbi:hypothetical protein D3C87_1996180 [compost metagenome]